MEKERLLVVLGATLVLVVPGACGVVIVGMASFANDIEPQSLEKVELPPPIVTLAEFEEIETSMSYREVVAVVGESGTEEAPSTAAGSTKRDAGTSEYVWRNSDASYMAATFRDDRLLTKRQLFLE